MGTKVPGYQRSQERKFPGTFVLWEGKFPRTKGPGNESFPENESSRERKVPGTKVPETFVPGKLGHSLANWDSCPIPAKSEAIEYLQVGPTEIRYSIAWTIFVYL